MSKLLKDLRILPQIESCYAFGDSHHINLRDINISIENLKNLLERASHKDIEISEILPSVEDCFMDLSSGDFLANSE